MHRARIGEDYADRGKRSPFQHRAAPNGPTSHMGIRLFDAKKQTRRSDLWEEDVESREKAAADEAI